MFGHKPSENARKIIDFLGCEYEYFPAGKNPAHIQSAYEQALAEVKREPYYPVIILVDNVLAETLEMFADELEPGETMGDRRRKIINEAVGSAEKWFSERLAEMKKSSARLKVLKAEIKRASAALWITRRERQGR